MVTSIAVVSCLNRYNKYVVSVVKVRRNVGNAVPDGPLKIAGERSQAPHIRILGGTLVGTRTTVVYLPFSLQ